jgi:deoxyribodipyrimidine photo-lyase
MVPPSRVRVVSDRPVDPDGDYVLYWMTATRRTTWSFALQHALDLCARLRKPLLVFEPLRIAYPWASRRIHRFVVQGMADQRRAFAAAGVRYYPYVERAVDADHGLLAALTARAVVVVTDRYPTFFHPHLVAAGARASRVQLVEVDSLGLLPLADAGRAWPSAVTFRRHFQRTWPQDPVLPSPAPLAGYAFGTAGIPAEVLARWPAADDLLDAPPRVDALVGGPGAVAKTGGSVAGGRILDRFVSGRLDRYTDRGDPDAEADSQLSPWLHFGHTSVHELFQRVVDREGWDPGKVGKANGSREGFWGMSAAAEAFLDEVITWRELGASYAAFVPDHAQYHSLPEWARHTLADHAADERPEQYSFAQLEAAETADPLWNAAQRQLLGEGVIHNAMRMLWGKKVLQWSTSPEVAWRTLVRLNDTYAIDGRDPNSYAGIGWVFGRFDRPWFPERPIFGTIRYMTSAQARKKRDLERWLDRWSGPTRP